jgi:hypothetical protein
MPQGRSGSGGEEKQYRHCTCQELNLCLPGHSIVYILTELLRNLICVSVFVRIKTFI